MKIPIDAARWRRSQIAETFASVRVSAPCYSFAEDVFGLAIVIAELELRQIQRQIFLANVVIGADDPALQQRPKIFDAVRMDDTAHVFALSVANRLMRHALLYPPVLCCFLSQWRLLSFPPM